jgi:hypothetical protein
MCAALERTGRIVGRDKTHMKAGDSIEAFADMIAKAPRVVVVISEKSLHSKFCMVDEIYSAYQRVGCRREEFRAKVIALVLEDATPFLNEKIRLLKYWKDIYEKESTELASVDQTHLQHGEWAKIHKLHEMWGHLSDMLVAINDTIMPRGYEAIVQGNFQEVIDRLPPKQS